MRRRGIASGPALRRDETLRKLNEAKFVYTLIQIVRPRTLKSNKEDRSGTCCPHLLLHIDHHEYMHINAASGSGHNTLS